MKSIFQVIPVRYLKYQFVWHISFSELYDKGKTQVQAYL